MKYLDDLPKFGDFYEFVREDGAKSAYRLVCVRSTRSYFPFEACRMTKSRRATEKMDAITEGQLLAYVCPNTFPDNGKTPQIVAPLQITMKSKRISGIFLDPENSCYGYGDNKGTNDAFLFVMSSPFMADGRLADGARLRIYVGHGAAVSKRWYCAAAADTAALYEEMEDAENNADTEDWARVDDGYSPFKSSWQ